MKKIFCYLLILFVTILYLPIAQAEDNTLPTPQTIPPSEHESVRPISNDEEDFDEFAIFDDKLFLAGYVQKYEDLPYEIILEMIKDDTLSSFKTAAAIRVFKNKHAQEIIPRDQRIAEKVLLRTLSRSDSPFVQVESMSALCTIDRYRYFNSMVPALIQKLTHYNDAVNEMAFDALDSLIKTGQSRTREARIVFNTLRKILFLSRKRLESIQEPNAKLSRQLIILRWAIKVLGNQELKSLPKEVIHLL